MQPINMSNILLIAIDMSCILLKTTLRFPELSESCPTLNFDIFVISWR